MTRALPALHHAFFEIFIFFFKKNFDEKLCDPLKCITTYVERGWDWIFAENTVNLSRFVSAEQNRKKKIRFDALYRYMLWDAEIGIFISFVHRVWSLTSLSGILFSYFYFSFSICCDSFHFFHGNIILLPNSSMNRFLILFQCSLLLQVAALDDVWRFCGYTTYFNIWCGFLLLHIHCFIFFGFWYFSFWTFFIFVLIFSFEFFLVFRFRFSVLFLNAGFELSFINGKNRMELQELVFFSLFEFQIQWIFFS